MREYVRSPQEPCGIPIVDKGARPKRKWVEGDERYGEKKRESAARRPKRAGLPLSTASVKKVSLSALFLCKPCRSGPQECRRGKDARCGEADTASAWPPRCESNAAKAHVSSKGPLGEADQAPASFLNAACEKQFFQRARGCPAKAWRRHAGIFFHRGRWGKGVFAASGLMKAEPKDFAFPGN